MTFSLWRSSFLAVAAAFAVLITLWASGENVQAKSVCHRRPVLDDHARVRESMD
jgi:hypothetical protein